MLLDAARSRLMRRLAGTLRHDLNSPLQAAMWAFDLVERGIASHPDAEQRAKLATSVDLGRRELQRLQKAARLFLTCAAPLDELAESFDLRDVLGEIERLVAAEASLRDIQLVFIPAPDTLGVNAVRHQVQQALLLLMLEGLDAAGQGGEIRVQSTLQAARVEVRFSHTVSAAEPMAHSPMDLAMRVIDTVASAHGGSVSRQDSTVRREISFWIVRRGRAAD